MGDGVNRIFLGQSREEKCLKRSELMVERVRSTRHDRTGQVRTR